MQDRAQRLSRRKFLASAAAAAIGGVPQVAARALDTSNARKPLAVVASVYRPLSDSYHIAGRFLHGYRTESTLHVPRHAVKSLFVEQHPENDLSRELAREFEFRNCRSVAEALTLGTSKLAVDGVLLVAEHGNYPRNDLDQVLYPRWEMFEQIVNVFRQTGQTVPVFVDRQLSHSGAKARQMADWARELGFPLMAGSSLPWTWRRPALELKPGSPVTEALVAAHGPIEANGFLALDALQAMVEHRGGDIGIQSVRCLSGKDVWEAGNAGLWSWDLLHAALARSETANLGDVRRNVGRYPVGTMPRMPATAFLLQYRDGLRATILLLNGHIQDFTMALRIPGQDRPASCLFHLPGPPGSKHFDCLAAQIEKLLEIRQSPVPLERSLLTTCTLEAVMTSRHLRGAPVDVS